MDIKAAQPRERAEPSNHCFDPLPELPKHWPYPWVSYIYIYIYIYWLLNSNTKQGMEMLLRNRWPKAAFQTGAGNLRSQAEFPTGDVIKNRRPKATFQKDEGSTQQQEKHQTQTQGRAWRWYWKKGGQRPPFKKMREAPSNRRSTKCKHEAGHGDVIEK